MRPEPVLVTGSTGYVGGRLIPQLLNAGHRVRALGRSVAKLQGRPWAGHPLVELAPGDVLDQESLNRAAAGCWAGFYLVHSMLADPKGFIETDRQAAKNMARAAAQAGLDRLIYLGGLGAGDTVLNQDFKEFIQSLNDRHRQTSGPGGFGEFGITLRSNKAGDPSRIFPP